MKLREKWQLRGPNVPVSPSFLQPDLALLVHGRRRFLPQQRRRVPGSCLHCYGPLALLMRLFYRRARETVSRLGFVWCRCQGLEQLHYVGIAQNVSLNCIFMNIVKVAMTWLHACSFAVLCVIGRRVSKDPGAPSSTVLNTRAVLGSRLCGLGKTGIDAICGMLGLLKCLVDLHYYKNKGQSIFYD